jgi:hypothetical protein
VAAEDPGVANWLDTTGITRGIALLRWYRADRHPVPEARRMPASEVIGVLPPQTPRLDPEQRRRRLAARREAVLRRYE